MRIRALSSVRASVAFGVSSDETTEAGELLPWLDVGVVMTGFQVGMPERARQRRLLSSAFYKWKRMELQVGSGGQLQVESNT